MRRLTRLTLTPRQYRQVAELALVFLTLIVFTGAAVRLSGSGLGCPDWPKCYGKVAPPLETHAVIEFGNRMLSGLVGLVAAAAGLLAFRRRPFRRDLALIGVLLPLGVVGQAVLGGFTVRNHLAPGFVMAHFALSMLILIAAAALAWRARWEPGERPRATDRLAVWSVRALLPLGALDDLRRHRGHGRRAARGRRGNGRRDRPARVEGRRHARLGDPPARSDRRPCSASPRSRSGSCCAVATPSTRSRQAMTRHVRAARRQGAVGAIQYQLELPAEIVWIHVALAACLWLSLLWATAAASSLAPRGIEPAGTEARNAAARLVRS